MFLTNVLLAKKAKAKHILVLMESMVSGHKFLTARERLGDKLELLHYDPHINDISVYKERKKVKSLSSSFRMDPKIQKMLGLDIDEEIKKLKM